MLKRLRESDPGVETTFGGAPINNITKGLPKTVESICPEPGCGRVIDARMFAEDGKAGVFYLHPNEAGARKLARFWARGIVNALK